MNYIALDTESSGLFDFKKDADAPGQPRMAAIGMIFADEDLNETERHSFLIKPNGWTFDDNCEAAQVNGLTHQRLMDEGIPVDEALKIYDRALDQRRIVIGHNVTHDMKLMRAELRYAGRADRFMETRHICTMWGSRAIVGALDARGKIKIPKLEEACAFFEIEIEAMGSHTGIGGAERALQILRCLRERGAMPAYKDPYDRGPKKKPAEKPAARRSGPDYERDILQAQEDERMLNNGFIAGAAEDGK